MRTAWSSLLGVSPGFEQFVKLSGNAHLPCLRLSKTSSGSSALSGRSGCQVLRKSGCFVWCVRWKCTRRCCWCRNASCSHWTSADTRLSQLRAWALYFVRTSVHASSAFVFIMRHHSAVQPAGGFQSGRLPCDGAQNAVFKVPIFEMKRLKLGSGFGLRLAEKDLDPLARSSEQSRSKSRSSKRI